MFSFLAIFCYRKGTKVQIVSNYLSENDFIPRFKHRTLEEFLETNPL